VPACSSQVATGAKLAAAAQRLGGQVETATVDAHDGTALEDFFSRLEPIDHRVSMVGDTMSGGFLTTTPRTMRHVMHSKFWTNWLIGRQAVAKLRDRGTLAVDGGVMLRK
jgi:hypothetical protein